jgi:hypothetical protein
MQIDEIQINDPKKITILYATFQVSHKGLMCGYPHAYSHKSFLDLFQSGQILDIVSHAIRDY